MTTKNSLLKHFVIFGRMSEETNDGTLKITILLTPQFKILIAQDFDNSIWVHILYFYNLIFYTKYLLSKSFFLLPPMEYIWKIIKYSFNKIYFLFMLNYIGRQDSLRTKFSFNFTSSNILILQIQIV